jgi:hypothetical protein
MRSRKKAQAGCAFFFTVLALFLVFVLSGGDSLVAQAERSVSLSGNRQPPGTASLSLSATASGDLTGTFGIAVTTEGTTVVGGSWHLVILVPTEEGTPREAGYLEGSVEVGGTATEGADGMLKLTSLRLKVENATGDYAGKTGVGSLDGSVGSQAASPFNGNLALTFDN